MFFECVVYRQIAISAAGAAGEKPKAELKEAGGRFGQRRKEKGKGPGGVLCVSK